VRTGRRIIALSVGILIWCCATSTWAGPIPAGEEKNRAEGGIPGAEDTELGVTLTQLFRFSGVTDDGEQGSSSRKEATSIHCTNFGATDAALEVQIYQWNGTDVFSGSIGAVPPGRTFTFSTQNTTIYFDDVIVGDAGGTPSIFQGSAIVWSDSLKVRCTAQVLDPLGYPPEFVAGLGGLATVIFVDGFESGTTIEWSSASP